MEEKKTIPLDKNDMIITSKGQSKIVEIIDEDDPETMRLKLDFQGKKETLNYKDLVFSVTRNARVIVSTYDGKLFDLLFPVDINITFDGFITSICEDYVLVPKQVCLIFRGNKLSKKEKEKLKFNKDFDFEKDYLIAAIGPSQETYMQTNKTFKRLDVKEMLPYKYIIKVSKPVFLTGLFIYSAWYEEHSVTYKDFSFEAIDFVPNEETELKTEPQKDKKKKAAKKKVEGLPAEAFDEFFNKPEGFEREQIHSFSSLDVFREHEDYRSDSESDREDDYYEKKTILGGRMHKVEFDKYLLVPEKYYYVSFKVGSSASHNVCTTSNKVNNRVQDARSCGGNLDIKIYLGNNQKDTLLIGGFSWILKSCFN